MGMNLFRSKIIVVTECWPAVQTITMSSSTMEVRVLPFHTPTSHPPCQLIHVHGHHPQNVKFLCSNHANISEIATVCVPFRLLLRQSVPVARTGHLCSGDCANPGHMGWRLGRLPTWLLGWRLRTRCILQLSGSFLQ